MKKKAAVFLILAAFLAALLMTGCQETEQAVQHTNSFTLNSDNSIVHKMVDALPEGETAESMQAYIEDSLAYYRQDTGRDGITLDECTVTGGSISITMTYASPGDFEAFNGVLFFSGTVKQAYEEGYSFQKIFTDTSGNTLSGSDVSSAYWVDKILIVNQPMSIEVPGQIMAASDLAQITGASTCTVTSENNEDLPEVFRTVNSSAAIIIYQ